MGLARAASRARIAPAKAIAWNGPAPRRSAARLARSRRLAHGPEAQHVHGDQHGDRGQHGGVGQPLDLRVIDGRRGDFTQHARDCRTGVPTRRGPRATFGRVDRGAPLARGAAPLLGLRRRRPRRRPDLPPLPRRASLARLHASRGGRRPGVGAARLRRPGPGAGRRPEVPRRRRPGRLAGGADRGGRARRLARARRRSWSPCRCTPRAGAARLQPGGAAGPRARRGAPACRCATACGGSGSAATQVGRGRRSASRGRPDGSRSRRAPPGGRSWSTTSSPPAPPSPPAPRCCGRTAAQRGRLRPRVRPDARPVRYRQQRPRARVYHPWHEATPTRRTGCASRSRGATWRSTTSSRSESRRSSGRSRSRSRELAEMEIELMRGAQPLDQASRRSPRPRST